MCERVYETLPPYEQALFAPVPRPDDEPPPQPVECVAGAVVHPGIVCNGSGESPLRGPRYLLRLERGLLRGPSRAEHQVGYIKILLPKPGGGGGGGGGGRVGASLACPTGLAWATP